MLDVIAAFVGLGGLEAIGVGLKLLPASQTRNLWQVR